MQSIVIEALINGDSELWVSPQGIAWKQVGNVSKPEKHDGHGNGNEPTYVNGKIWMPKWGNPNPRGRDQRDVYPLNAGPTNELNFTLLAVSQKRERDGIDPRDKIVVRHDNSGAMVLLITDHQVDSRWYRLGLYRGNTPPPPESPAVEK